ncbi:PucR family transcriptional regulator [Motilibacter aurantiacus]|uniref:PucR family transcriptional regulator n=1 Tax=Motilibacter aurantiacus TaxID=2714955 RepID=UPI001408754B|nr:helix-turn-helix domain-containing protein [Motilibacter aurantiacus]NHC47346.1 PucR family transcriptional regulator [Motilibacter aurantiacus]
MSEDGTTAAELAAALAAAGDDASLRVGLLGDFLPLLVTAAREARRPTPQEIEPFRGLGARAAEEGAPLRDLVDLYLSAAWRVWPLLPPLQAAVSTGNAAAVQGVALGVLRASDDVVQAVALGYDEARRQAARREEALRRELVDDLLGGSGDATVLAERIEVLGLRLVTPHRVLAVRGDAPLVDGGRVARLAETALRLRPGAGDVLVTSKDGLLACVVPAVEDGSSARVLLERLRAGEPGTPWQIVATRARPGVTGVRDGWQEALETLDVAGRLGLEPGLVHADDLLAHRALLRDREALSDLVEHVLAPLRAARGGAGPLVETLLALSDAGGNQAEAARSLHLSNRALLYRLERIEALTAYSLDDPVQRYALQTAAVGARLLGWAG